jgi:hypothetical protein
MYGALRNYRQYDPRVNRIHDQYDLELELGIATINIATDVYDNVHALFKLHGNIVPI